MHDSEKHIPAQDGIHGLAVTLMLIFHFATEVKSESC